LRIFRGGHPQFGEKQALIPDMGFLTGSRPLQLSHKPYSSYAVRQPTSTKECLYLIVAQSNTDPDQLVLIWLDND
jgi:hypothetical protein